MIVGGYSLDLYCDNPSCPHLHDPAWWPKEYSSELGSTCRRTARKDGWKLDIANTLCPDCHKTEKDKKP